MRLRTSFAVFLAALAAPAVAAEPVVREWNGDALVSRSEPVAEFSVASEFEYVGAFAFDLRGVARVERHLWAETEDNAISGLIIIQFERYLDGIDATYGFAVPPEDQRSGGDYLFSSERVSFGGPGLVHNTWAFDQGASAAEDPDAESAATLRFLEQHGLTLADEVIMSRAVRVSSADDRSEVILFYIEPLVRRGASLSEFDPNGPITPAFRAISLAVTNRHLEALREVTIH